MSWIGKSCIGIVAITAVATTSIYTYKSVNYMKSIDSVKTNKTSYVAEEVLESTMLGQYDDKVVFGAEVNGILNSSITKDYAVLVSSNKDRSIYINYGRLLNIADTNFIVKDIDTKEDSINGLYITDRLNASIVEGKEQNKDYIVKDIFRYKSRLLKSNDGIVKGFFFIKMTTEEIEAYNKVKSIGNDTRSN